MILIGCLQLHAIYRPRDWGTDQLKPLNFNNMAVYNISYNIYHSYMFIYKYECITITWFMVRSDYKKNLKKNVLVEQYGYTYCDNDKAKKINVV